MGTVLEQALKTKDNDMLEYVLRVQDRKMIEATVERLPPTKVLTFLTKVVDKFEKRPSRGSVLCVWIRTILMAHTSYLMTVPDLVESLSALYQTLEVRLRVFQDLWKLSGRLDLVMDQISQRARSQEENAQEKGPKSVYQEGEDDDDEEDEDDLENGQGEGSEDDMMEDD